MASRRVLKSVLHNFLGTFVSRYSDHGGYWLLGQIPADLDRWVVDLLEDPPEGESPLEVARRIAWQRFREQLVKAGLDMAVVREASLSWQRHETALGWQGEHEAQGHRVELQARAVTDTGVLIERRQSSFVAVHDPARERRRMPLNWGI